jgi:hypothetical protein
MRIVLAAALIPLLLAGCIGVRTVDVPAASAAPQTVIVTAPAPAPPPVVICSNGAPAPCP